MSLAAALVFAYLIGSIDFALVIARLKGVDIRAEGSGNPGATNVARVIGKREGALVMAGDLAKGFTAAVVGEAMGGSVAAGYAAGGLAVVGHCYPVWHRWRGGKGVAATGGMLFWLAPLVGLVLAVVWVGVVAMTRTSSLGSLAAAALTVPGVALTEGVGWELAIMGAVALLVGARHHANIRRLLAGREGRAGERGF